MPAPETDWVDGIIPPARHWVVRYRYIGVSSGRMFDNPDACFASDAICRRIYSRYPTDRDGNYQPINAHPEPLDPADPGDPACDFYYGHADSEANPDPLRGDDAGGAGDGDGACGSDLLRADDGDPGNPEGVLLGSGPADADVDPHASPVRDTRAADALLEDKGELR